MRLEEALEEGRQKYLERELHSLRAGGIYVLRNDNLKEEAESQGKLREFYEALRHGLPSFDWSVALTPQVLIAAIRNLEVVGRKIGESVDDSYREQLTKKVLKYIRKGNIGLAEAAEYMRQEGYPI